MTRPIISKKGAVTIHTEVGTLLTTYTISATLDARSLIGMAYVDPVDKESRSILARYPHGRYRTAVTSTAVGEIDTKYMRPKTITVVRLTTPVD